MTLQDKVGKAIIQLRKERGISQETFAFEAGIDRRNMSDIENGKRNISLDILERVCEKTREIYQYKTLFQENNYLCINAE